MVDYHRPRPTRDILCRSEIVFEKIWVLVARKLGNGDCTKLARVQELTAHGASDRKVHELSCQSMICRNLTHNLSDDIDPHSGV